MISEDYKSRIQRLAGLLTEDELLMENNIGKLQELGFSEQFGNYLLELSKKYSIFLGNILTKEFAKEKGNTSGHIKNILPMLDQEELLIFSKSKAGDINFILEWINDVNKSGENLDLRQIDNISDSLERANEWYALKRNTTEITDESGNILKVFPDKYYFIDLKTNDSPQEASAMGHCGRDGQATTILSLRDSKKEPHVTIAYNSNKQAVTQVKGKENKHPIEAYMPYVFQFLGELSEKGFVIHTATQPVGLVNFVWSYGKDLSQEEIKKVFSKEKYALYVYNALVENLGNTYYGNIGMSIEEAKVIIGPELYKKYVFKLLAKTLENPAYNRIGISQEEVKQVIGEENHKKFVAALVQKMVDGGNIHSLGSVVQRLRDNYGLNLTQQELKTYVGAEKYREYITTLLEKAIENPVINKLEVTKQEIVDELGLEKYIEYIEAVLSKVLENPASKKLNLSKEEIVETLGEDRYNKFVISLVNKMFDSENISGLNGLLGMLKNNYNLDYTPQQVKDIIGEHKYIKYIKDLYDKAMINPLDEKLDVSKSVIVDELGMEKYAQYINKILDVAVQEPVNRKLVINKDEVIDTLGAAKYDEFVKKLVNAFIDTPSFYGTARLLAKLELNYGINMEEDDAERLVGPKKWFFFMKRSDAAYDSNIRD